MIDRIREIIFKMGLSDRAFANRCGIAQNTLSRQLSGKYEISLTTIVAILSNFPDISSEWLIRGEGNMLKNNTFMDNNSSRMERLIDTITTLQETINEKSKTIQLLEEENRKLKTELTVKKIG